MRDTKGEGFGDFNVRLDRNNKRIPGKPVVTQSHSVLLDNNKENNKEKIRAGPDNNNNYNYNNLVNKQSKVTN